MSAKVSAMERDGDIKAEDDAEEEDETELYVRPPTPKSRPQSASQPLSASSRGPISAERPPPVTPLRSLSFKVERKEEEEEEEASKAAPEIDTTTRWNIKLLERERKESVRSSSISTVTFFKGKLENSTIDFLRYRFREIMTSNPWLNSRLIKDEHSGELVLSYTRANTWDALFQVVNEASLPSPRDMHSLDWIAENYTLGKAIDTYGKDIPLFKVSILSIIQNQFYALVVSMSQVLGGSSTFYRIYGMFNRATDVTEIKCKRQFDADRSLYPKFRDTDRFVHSIGFKANILRQEWALPRGLHKYGIISSKEIQTTKLAYITAGIAAKGKKLVPFISSNDIISSKIFSLLNVDIGLMAVDCRERVSDLIDKDMAGNYQFYTGYLKEDYQKPEFIRKSIIEENFTKYSERPVTKDQPLIPGLLTRMKARVATIANFSTYYEHVSIDGVAHVIHLPICSSFKNTWDRYVIFTPSPGKLGIWTVEDTRVDKETNKPLTASPLERFKAAKICSPEIDINIFDILSNAEGKKEEKEGKERLRKQQTETARMEMEREMEQQRGKKAEMDKMDQELLAVLNELKEREDAQNREEPQTNTP